MIRFWGIEQTEGINITHKSLLRWNAVTNFYCIPMLFIHWQTRKNRDIQKYQYLDYQKINQLDVVKHNVKLLCDFYRLSSITKFEVRRNRDTQTSIFWLSDDYPCTLKQGAWVSAAFTPEFSQVFAIRPERPISCQSASHAARTLPCHRWHYSWFWRDNYR